MADPEDPISASLVGPSTAVPPTVMDSEETGVNEKEKETRALEISGSFA